MAKSLAALMLAFTATVSPTTPREVVQSAVTRAVNTIEVAESDRADRVEPRTAAAVERTRTQLRRIAVGLLDFDEMARRTLSQHWARRTPAEQADFVALLTELLERSYVEKIESYAGERIVYTGETVDGSYALVRSKIVHPRPGRDTALDYRLLRRDGQWRVYDVVVDGVSFVSTYRTEFNRVIAKSSYRALVESLRKGQLQVRIAARRS